MGFSTVLYVEHLRCCIVVTSWPGYTNECLNVVAEYSCMTKKA